MAEAKILVLGGTGPAGICLLRELAHRNHAAVIYARSPEKIPAELATHKLFTIVKGTMDDEAAFSDAASQCTSVISLLGPDIKKPNIDPTLYSDMYKSKIFPVMRKHGIRRIIAMGTISIRRSEDSWTAFQAMVQVFMRLFAGNIYKNMIDLAALFNVASDLDWTLFRIAQIPGESDEASWKADREEKTFAGWVGEKGWTTSIKRAALTKWLVDSIGDSWIRKMPAISRSA